MKLLVQYSNILDAEYLSERLRNKGVMTYISSSKSHSMGRIQSGALRVGVWVVLESQYEDAFTLLRNKRHKANAPLTKEEMVELELTTKKCSTKKSVEV